MIGTYEATARWTSTCPTCGATIRKGSRIVVDRARQQAHHLSCPSFKLPRTAEEPRPPRKKRRRGRRKR